MRPFTTLTLLLALPGCWNLPEDDAGDRAFATWATTAILGRGPVSPQELDALLELQDEHGREALLDTLLQQPEFVEHWDDLLMHQLRVRTRFESNTGQAVRARKEDCFTKDLLPQSYDHALTEHLRTADWNEPFCQASGSDDLVWSTGGRTAGAVTEDATGQTLTAGPPADRQGGTDQGKSLAGAKTTCFEFTMKDVIRASLRTDRMDALMRAYLAPLAAFDSPVNARRTVFDSYFNRHQDCLECHTTTYSTTNPVPRNDYWDRYYPAETVVDLEYSAFWSVNANGTIRDGSLGGDTMQQRFRDLFNRVQATDKEAGVHPWGFDASCMEDGLLEEPRPNDDGSPTAFAGWGLHTGTDVRILDFVNEYDDGLRALAERSALLVDRRAFEDVDDHDASVLSTCNTCHELPVGTMLEGGYLSPPPLYDLTASMSAARIHKTIVEGSPAGQMAGNHATGDTVDQIVGHLVSNQSAPVDVYWDPTVGMAHLTALGFVDDIAAHLSGQSLTLEHGFPRNDDQALVLKALADGLIDNDWSLRYVIKAIALSELMNRQAPEDSSADPYALPMIFDPWQDTSAPNDADSLTGVAANGQGDAVHRWPVATLIRKRNAALGWSQPTHFDDEGLRTDLGGYVAFDVPGFTSFGMASALAWETHHEGCESPYGDGTDVIDTLTAAEHGLSLRQAVQALKFRTIGEEALWSDPADGLAGLESNRIAEIWDVEPSDPASKHVDVLREVCEVLLASPQFVLAGVPAAPTGSAYTDPDVPCLDEHCSEVAWCEHYRDTAVDLGYDSWSCLLVGGVGTLSR
ncbi:MAG: hypothetical protein KTR31_38175 [Myxococcales bacterium]|nr:hypothetical protein [Myxococcales bacterium]